jgi:hypothetical protein
MLTRFRFLLRIVPVWAVLLAPLATGAVTVGVTTVALYVVVLGAAACILQWSSRTSLANTILLSVCATCLTFALVDLAARPFLNRHLWVRANALFGHRWERMPLIQRYPANISYQGKLYGDLASGTGIPSDREWRQEVFRTDQSGFRVTGSRAIPRTPIQLIVLGDSFAEGANTTEDETLAAHLYRNGGYAMRNLAMGGAGPWEEYINLSIESEQMRLSPNAIVLWVLFAGNDLDDACYPMLEIERLPWRGRGAAFLRSYQSFVARSPVRVLLARATAALRIRGSTRAQTFGVESRAFMGRSMLFLSEMTAQRQRSSADVVQHRNWPCISSVFAAMQKLTEQKQLRVAVAVVPSKEEVYTWLLDGHQQPSENFAASGFAIQVGELSKRSGFQFFDLKRTLAEEAIARWANSQAPIWWFDDVHWNGAGQRVAAAAIEAELLQPLRDRAVSNDPHAEVLKSRELR